MVVVDVVNPNASPANKVSEVIKKDEVSQGETTCWGTDSVCSVVNNPYVHHFLLDNCSVDWCFGFYRLAVGDIRI